MVPCNKENTGLIWLGTLSTFSIVEGNYIVLLQQTPTLLLHCEKDQRWRLFLKYKLHCDAATDKQPITMKFKGL